MADGELDVTLLNGAVRNSENEHIAKLLRQKSKVFVAFGSCAYMGGIPGLANLFPRGRDHERAYLDNASIEAGNHTVPLPHSIADGYALELPKFYERVYALDDDRRCRLLRAGLPAAARPVQGGRPGAGRRPHRHRSVPPKGAVVGAFERALCDDCQRNKKREEGQALLPALADHAGP